MHQVNWTYSLIMLGALVACSLLLRRTQSQLSIAPIKKFAIGLGAFIGAMVGAKIPFLFADWSGIVAGTAWLTNGKTIMCGMVGGYLGVEIAKWTTHVNVKTGDSFAVPVAVAVGIGRLACFQGGCCFGTETDLPWGVCFASHDGGAMIPRHPTQIYEALFHFTMAGLMLWVARINGQYEADKTGFRATLFRISHGQLIKAYIVAYLIYRFLTEFIRPEAEIWLGLTGYQWAAIGLLPVFVGLWYHDYKAQKKRMLSPTPSCR